MAYDQKAIEKYKINKTLHDDGKELQFLGCCSRNIREILIWIRDNMCLSMETPNVHIYEDNGGWNGNEFH